MSGRVAQLPRLLHGWADDVLSPWRLLPPLNYLLTPLINARGENHEDLDLLVSRLRARNVLHPFTFFPEGFEAVGGADASVLPLIRAAARAAAGGGVGGVGGACAGSPAVALSPSPSGRAYAHVAEGSFPAPEDTVGLLPPESRVARFQLVTPLAWGAGRPVAVLLPGTGEQGFTRRRHFLAYPLAQKGVGSVILEGPFYGSRRPPNMVASKLRALCDLPLLGFSTMLEARALVAWLRARTPAEAAGLPAALPRGARARPVAAGGGGGGGGHLAVVLAGTSMGGLHAAMAASLVPRAWGAVGVTSWLGPPSGVGVFTSGSLSTAVDWAALSAGAGAPHLDAAIGAMECLARPGAFVSALPAPAAARALEAHWPRVPPAALARGVAQAARLLRITDLADFPPPAAPHLAEFITAAKDLYCPPEDAHWEAVQGGWVGCTMRRLPKGHVTGSLSLEEYVESIVQLAARVHEEAR
jgi:hypothetical protein